MAFHYQGLVFEGKDGIGHTLAYTGVIQELMTMDPYLGKYN